MYKVIGKARSRALRVMWMLQEIGAPYQQIEAAPGSEDAQQYTSQGRIPALVDGSEVLTDSVAIMTYLADKHGKLTAPAGTIARARQDAMTLWLIDEMDSVLRSAARHSHGLPEDLRVPAVLNTLKFEFKCAAETLSARLEGPFLMGKAMSLPDILAGHCLSWAVGAKFPRPDHKLSFYLRTLRQRPAFMAASARGNSGRECLGLRV